MRSLSTRANYVVLMAVLAAATVGNQERAAGEYSCADVISRYEASLRSLTHVRMRVQDIKFFVGGPFTKNKEEEDTRVLDVKRDCVRDAHRWKFTTSQWELARINGKWQELRLDKQDVGAETGWVTVWVHPPDGKREREEFRVQARLADQAPPARTQEEVADDGNDSDTYAWVPWPLELEQGAFMFGYLSVDRNTRLSHVIEESRPRIVSGPGEGLSNQNTVLVESRGKYGRHRVWFDPSAGYLPRRVEVQKSGADIFGTKTVAELGPHHFPDSFWPDLAVEKVDILISDVDITKVNDEFVTAGFTYTLTRHHAGGATAAERTEIRITDIDLNPTYDASDFKITVPIPNGTYVQMRGVPQIGYEWRDGQVVKSLDESAAHALAGQTFSASEGTGRTTLLLVGAALVGALLVAVAVWSRRGSARVSSPEP